MNKLLKYIRYYIVIGSLILAVVLNVVIKAESELGQTYAFLAVGFLYLALLVTPLYLVFPRLPYRAVYTKARRALGFSAFIFALLHGYYEYFRVLGGFQGVQYLTSKYALAVELGIINLSILFLMAITSFDKAVKYLGSNWKILHRFVYLAGLLIIVHVVILGSSFTRLYSPTAVISFLLLFFILALEFLRFYKYIAKKFKRTKGL